jgi:hypothetical protein
VAGCKNESAVGVPIADKICVRRKLLPYREARLQFTIETRELSNPRSNHMKVEAADADDAISRFVAESASELMSVTKPCDGRESIATVRKDDSVFLVRVYAA